MVVRLQAKVRERGLGLRPRLYAGSVCDAHRCRSMQLVPLYRCSAFPFFAFLYSFIIPWPSVIISISNYYYYY